MLPIWLTIMTSIATLFSKFPSLQVTPQKPLLGLYFAASWCPDCTGVTPVVQEVLEKNTADMNVVYVASDSTEEQMKSYIPASFAAVPFGNAEERSNLKRHFGACASKEVAPLGMTREDRKHGIPTLILLDSDSGRIVTTSGVDDIMGSNRDAAVDGWKNLLKESS